MFRMIESLSVLLNVKIYTVLSVKATGGTTGNKFFFSPFP